MREPKDRLIAVEVGELKAADMEIIRQMEVCPSCGTEAKSGEYFHLMCYRCYEALPTGVRQRVDGEPTAVMLAAFLIYMKVLGRTHALLTRRGEDPSAVMPSAATAVPAPAALVTHRPAQFELARPVRRVGSVLNGAMWETVWREDG